MDMATRYSSDVGFTPTVKAIQARKGSRASYVRMEEGGSWQTTITPDLAGFIAAQTSVFLGIVKELYRIAKPDARVVINVPHPRHDHFLGDPTHVRAINPLVLSLFSKKANLYWKEINAANSPLAIYLNVDFEVIETVHVLDPHYQGLLDRKEMTMEELTRYVQERNNVVQEYRFLLRVIK